MLHSPEIELLLLCARPRLSDEAVGRIRALLAQPLDWPLVFGLAEDYRTIPLLALHLHHHAEDLLTSDIRTRLQRHHLNSTRHTLVLAAEVLRLVDLVSAEGVDIVAFKGPVSAVLAYGDMAMRACGDIDLLVKPHDHSKAERLLANDGYRVQQRYQAAMQSSLWHDQRQVSVDLHWGMPPEILHLNAERLWGDVGPVTLLGQPVPTFSIRDTLLVTAINAVKEYWKPSLHHLSDIAALTDSYTDADWLVAFDRAREIGCQRMLVAALLFAQRLLDMPLPTAGPVGLFRRRGIGKAVDELTEHLFLQPEEQTAEAPMKLKHHPALQAYYLTLTDSPWRRSRDWLTWVGSPNTADEAFIRLPKRLWFLYFLIRPLRLLLKRL
jgi:hypothetical protein